MITTKRHPFKFYAAIIFMSGFYIAMACILGDIFWDEYKDGFIQPKTYGLLIPICIFIAFPVYSVWQYYKNTPIVKLTEKEILIGKERFSLSEIKKIKFIGKMPFKYLINFPMEGAAIHFKNHEVRFLYDDVYTNLWEVKNQLYNQIIRKGAPTHLHNTAITSKELRFVVMENFKGMVLFSMRGLLTCFFGIVVIFGIVASLSGTKIPPGGWIFLAVMLAAFYLFSKFFLNYFSLSKEYFVVRNHILFWRKDSYRIQHIKKVVFESQGKAPNGLRITTKDFKTNLYHAATLRDATWKELMIRLRKHGVKVKNDNIYLDI